MGLELSLRGRGGDAREVTGIGRETIFESLCHCEDCEELLPRLVLVLGV